MNLVIHSNAPWFGTGYGGQTDEISKRINESGRHHVDISAFAGLHGRALNMNGMTVFPGGYTSYGVDVIVNHARNAKASAVITLIDAWVLNPPVPPGARRWFEEIPWICYAPIDHDPIPPAVMRALVSPEGRVQPWKIVSFSKHAFEAYRQVGLLTTYIPHCVDTNAFAPMMDNGSYVPRSEVRKSLGIPEDLFLVTMVAANKGLPCRKSFPEAIEAFARFRAKHCKNSAMYLHTESTGVMEGINLIELREQIDAMLRREGVGEFPKEAMLMADQYHLLNGFPRQYLNQVYNASDVLLSPSMGEGFGVPILEAQACGTPVIVGNWTAMPELCFSGWRVDGQRTYTVQAAWQHIPNMKSIERALRSSLGSRDLASTRTAARNGAMEYDADRVVSNGWLPFLDKCESELADVIAKREQVSLAEFLE